MNTETKFHELTEKQIEAIVSKLPMPILTDVQERYIADDFANGHKWILRSIVMGETTTASAKKHFRDYRKYRIELMRWQNWIDANAVKYDHNRGKYVGHF